MAGLHGAAGPLNASAQAGSGHLPGQHSGAFGPVQAHADARAAHAESAADAGVELRRHLWRGRGDTRHHRRFLQGRRPRLGGEPAGRHSRRIRDGPGFRRADLAPRHVEPRVPDDAVVRRGRRAGRPAAGWRSGYRGHLALLSAARFQDSQNLPTRPGPAPGHLPALLSAGDHPGRIPPGNAGTPFPGTGVLRAAAFAAPAGHRCSST